MDSPSAIVEREKRLLQLNAAIDSRFKSLDRAAVPAKKPSQIGSRVASKTPRTEINHILRPRDIQEQYRNLKFNDKTESGTNLLQAPKDDDSSKTAKNPSPRPKPLPPKVAAARNTAFDELTRRNLSTEATIRFLKSKVTLLQAELDATREDQTAKAEIIHKQTENAKKSQLTADRLNAHNKALAEQVAKLERSLADASEVAKLNTSELAQTKATLDERTKELAKQQHEHSILDRRLLKAAEDLETARQNALAARAAELDANRAHKADRQHAETELRLLAEQRAGLIAAYKKQMFLLDNLKRQNVCLEQAKLVEFVERDFVRMLESHKS